MVSYKYKISTFGETKRLTGIDETIAEAIMFTEKLYVFNEEGRRIGRFSIKIDREEIDYTTTNILYVHISNRAFVDGKLTESIVTGTVTPTLRTLEEIRYQCTNKSDWEKHERILFLLRETTKYYLSVTNKVCQLKNQTHSSITFVEALGLIGESANAIFLRILAFKGYEGIICMKTILPNGKRCRNYYVTKLSEQTVNGKRMQVLVVYRNITNHKKINLTMTMALTRAGQMIYLFWSNTKTFLHIDPDAEIRTSMFNYGNPKLHFIWHKDIQLYSQYLDKVDQGKLYCRSYKYENEPLRRIVGDFLEYVLLLKPNDVVCFAVKYFTAFGEKPRPACAKERYNFDYLDELNEMIDHGHEGSYSYLGEKENMFYGEA